MTLDELYEFLHTWIYSVLATDLGADESKVIKTNMNAPRPAIPYITMQYPPINNEEMGEGNQSDSDATGKVTYFTPYNASISLTEVGGDGTLLKKLLRTRNQQDILDLFSTNNVSLLSGNTVQDITVNTGDNYIELRAMWDFIVSYVEEDSYIPGYIKTIEIAGDLDGSVEEHHIELKLDIETQEVIDE